MSEVPHFTKENMVGGGRTFYTWRKKSETRAARITGPFTVETTEGTLSCQDGWLAIDARGNPYPVAADEFALIYEPA